MNTIYCTIFLSLALIAFPAAAQSEKVFDGASISASALIDALEGDTTTRQIKVMPDGTIVKPVPKPAKASLLITFETNSANLTPRAKKELDVVGQALNSPRLARSRFSIEGHADPRGIASANFQLSQARAESVRQYLIEVKHIDDGRLDAVGKGDRELLNNSNVAAPENRRVTFVNVTPQ